MRAGTRPHHDVQGVVLHGGVEDLLDGAGQAVDLVDEEDVALVQVGEDRRQIPLLVDGRAGGDPQVDASLPGDDHGEGGLAQSGRAVEQHMV